MKTRHGRVFILGAMVPSLFAALLCVWQPSRFTRLEQSVYDVIVRAAGTRPHSRQILIVDVDDRSLSAVGQWPWSRHMIANLLTKLRDLEASVVALDVMFPEPDRHDGGAVPPDAALADVLQGGGVLLGYGFTFDSLAGTQDASPPCLKHPASVALLQRAGEHSVEPFFRATEAVCNLPILAEAAQGAGFLNAAPDTDGILRRVPLLVEYRGNVYPSLALAAISAAERSPRAMLRVANVNTTTLVLTGSEGQASSRRQIPLDGRSNLLVRYRGGKRSFPYVSAVDVLNGSIATDTVKGKIVFVGATALGTREVVATPLDTLFTGVEVQATVADNLLQQDFVRRPEHAVMIQTLFVLALGAVIGGIGSVTGAIGAAVGLLALLASCWIASIALLSTYGIYLSPLFATIALVGVLAGLALAGLSVEHEGTQQARRERSDSQRLMVETLLSLVEMRDTETGRHSRRTQEYTRILADELRGLPGFRDYLTPERITLLSTLAPLHDIGKVGISDRVLHKPGPLTPEELAEMRQHPIYGRNVIINAERAAGVRDDATLAVAKDIVYSHHERWDGTGYPEGLSGEAIPIAGRIIGIVDLYDALLSSRPYHQARTHAAAVAFIAARRGTHFDPDVVDAWLRVAHKLEAVPRGEREQLAAS
jgi:CHASE2 domain-containing sensor protein